MVVHTLTRERFDAPSWMPILEPADRSRLSAADLGHIDDVLSAYGHPSDYGLGRLCRSEQAWAAADGGAMDPVLMRDACVPVDTFTSFD